jgi:hypothetical protein
MIVFTSNIFFLYQFTSNIYYVFEELVINLWLINVGVMWNIIVEYGWG